MKHKTWFRLVIKAIGVLLVGLSLPQIAQAVGFALYMLIEPGMTGGLPYNVMQFVYYSGSLLQLGVGLYLFFGGKWIVNKAIPSNRPYCPDCGYDLSNAKSPRCAECGCVLPPPFTAPATN